MLCGGNGKRTQGNEWSKPKSGNEFVTITVNIENKGKEKLDYNPLYFKLQNSQGQQEGMTFTTINQDTDGFGFGGAVDVRGTAASLTINASRLDISASSIKF